MKTNIEKRYEKIFIFLGLIVSLLLIILGIVLLPSTIFVFVIGIFLFLIFTANAFTLFKKTN